MGSKQIVPENPTVFQEIKYAAGALLEVRHIVNPLIGYEATYAYNRANQAYSSPISGVAIPFFCAPSCLGQPIATLGSVPANAHEVTGDWIVSLGVRSFRPFALAGGGVLFDVPAGGQATTVTTTSSSTATMSSSTATKGVFVYGVGVDWTLFPHQGLRFQYRGNLYKAPNLTTLFTSTGAFTHTAEPMIGIFFRL